METEQLVLLIIIPVVFLLILPALTKNKDKNEDEFAMTDEEIKQGELLADEGGELLTDEEEKKVWEEYQGKVEEDK
jgi:hypothetical protein